MGTRIYGASDDLIECDGDVSGETAYLPDNEDAKGAVVLCSDGTVLLLRYGKGTQGIWVLTLLAQGTLFDSIYYCMDEDARPHSDIAYLGEGLLWIYVAVEWDFFSKSNGRRS